jgi:hypothetical protein
MQGPEFSYQHQEKKKKKKEWPYYLQAESH